MTKSEEIEDVKQTLDSLRCSERGYRERGFHQLAGDYLPDIAKYETRLKELTQ
jgi:hypothetical protein